MQIFVPRFVIQNAGSRIRSRLTHGRPKVFLHLSAKKKLPGRGAILWSYAIDITREHGAFLHVRNS